MKKLIMTSNTKKQKASMKCTVKEINIFAKHSLANKIDLSISEDLEERINEFKFYIT